MTSQAGTPETTKKPAPGQTIGARPGPVFDPADFADELATAARNEAVGTEIWFENDRVQVWDLALAPGERVAFHCHQRDYFWTVTDPSRLMQRFDDGTSRIADVAVGHTNFMEYGDGEKTIHDLQNIGEDFFRCVTVVLK
ncbi:hypothetical protein [Nonomuraea lactucae]|uniref:hypothetical protein n=1 Tax=Nonomuraea lactucae TaxID=2249762 RepID=UPI000DE3B21A|nr:hypothetical protein [Nonomuraea lactucae]